MERVVPLLRRSWPLCEDDPGVTAVLSHLKRPGERRDAWGLLCALLALAAYREQDWERFYCAAFAVQEAHQQAWRGSAERSMDALGQLIAAYLSVQPELNASELYNDFANQASDGFQECLADYDRDTDVLTFQRAPNGEMEDISREGFARRVTRIKQKLTQAEQCEKNSESRLAATG